MSHSKEGLFSFLVQPCFSFLLHKFSAILDFIISSKSDVLE